MKVVASGKNLKNNQILSQKVYFIQKEGKKYNQETFMKKQKNCTEFQGIKYTKCSVKVFRKAN